MTKRLKAKLPGLVPFLLWSILLLPPNPAVGLQNCNNVQISSDIVLTDDYQTTIADFSCFMLHNGADVDMNGHSITCRHNNNWDISCVAGIYAQDPGSIVENSSGSESVILGPYRFGTRGAQVVRDIKIELFPRDSEEYHYMWNPGVIFYSRGDPGSPEHSNSPPSMQWPGRWYLRQHSRCLLTNIRQLHRTRLSKLPS